MANGNFAGGSGTNSDPYLIEDDLDLDAIRNDLSASYKLISDIDLSNNFIDGWIPIAQKPYGRTEFSGDLYGNEHAIKNLHINDTSIKENWVGLFAGTSGIIKNLIIQNVSIDVGEDVSNPVGGALICGMSPSAVIENCIVDGGTINIANAERLGALVGTNKGLIKNCISRNVEISGTGNSIGGLLGYLSYEPDSDQDGDIYNCISISQVLISDGENIGGIIGEKPRYDNGTFEELYYDKDISGCSDTYEGITPLTTSEIKNTSNYSSWDTDVWRLSDGSYPQLYFEILYKHLFNDNGNIKTYDNGWNTLGTDTTEQHFLDNGLQDLNILFEKDITKSYTTTTSSSLGEGLKFEQEVDFSEFENIDSVEVQ